MLLFRSEEAIDTWCAQEDMARGQVLSIEQVWRLSQAWYGDRLSADYVGRDAEEVNAVFDSVGLTDPFWDLATEPS